MNISQEKTNDLTTIVKIEVQEADYSEQFEKELRNYRKQASLPGFRAGKVPMGIIKKKYGTALKVEEVNKLVSKSLNDYISDEKLDILGYPLNNIDKGTMPDFENQNDFEFYFDLAMSPEFSLDISESNEAEFLKIIINDTMLEKFIDDIRKRSATFEDVDDIQEEDMVEVKIEELNDDNTVNGDRSYKNTSIIPTYLKEEDTREEFLKLKTGDTIIFNPLKVTGNATETATMLGIEKEEAENLEKDFQFTVVKSSRQKLAEVNEDLFKSAFPNDEITDEEQFRARVMEEAVKVYEQESDKYFLHKTMEQFYDQTDMTLPDDFLKRWLFVSNEGKIPEEDIEKDYPHYQRSMKMQLIENRLVKENEGLKVTEQDIKNQIKQYFSMYMPPMGDDEEWEERMSGVVDNYMKNEEEVQKIQNQIFDQRLIALLKDKLKIVDKEVSYDEFLAILKESQKHMHHDHEHDHDHDHHGDEGEPKVADDKTDEQ